MKKITLMMVLFLFVTGISNAQERGGGQRPSRNMEQSRPGDRGDRPRMSPEEMQKRQTQRLVEELKLTSEQETKVVAINKKYQEKNPVDWSKMRDASDDERASMRESMRKVQAEKDQEIKAILTAEQVKLYDDMLKRREEMRRNAQGRMRNGRQ